MKKQNAQIWRIASPLVLGLTHMVLAHSKDRGHCLAMVVSCCGFTFFLPFYEKVVPLHRFFDRGRSPNVGNDD
ncbi:MAG: hypothetical protein IJU90_07755 [Bacteroidales bacterium]|nr:hypothetical protein [Bacteroidales bacterium]